MAGASVTRSAVGGAIKIKHINAVGGGGGDSGGGFRDDLLGGSQRSSGGSGALESDAYGRSCRRLRV